MGVLRLEIDEGVPLPTAKSTPKMVPHEGILAAGKTAELLAAFGLELQYDAEAKDTAAKILLLYAGHPLRMLKERMSDRDLESHSVASVALASQLLREFGQSTVQSAQEVRNLVTNKLLVESENPDPKIRLKALEMLGKISDVGLFTEKSEITITHQTDTALQDRVREKLERLRRFEAEVKRAEDAVIVEDDPKAIEQDPLEAVIVPIRPETAAEEAFDDD